jgi:hypothetical protein
MVRVKKIYIYTKTNKHARKIARKNMVDNLGVLKRENAGIGKWKNPPITPSSLSTAEIVKKKTHPPTRWFRNKDERDENRLKMDVKSGNWKEIITMVQEASACKDNIWLRKYNTPCSVQNYGLFVCARMPRQDLGGGGDRLFPPQTVRYVWCLGTRATGKWVLYSENRILGLQLLLPAFCILITVLFIYCT